MKPTPWFPITTPPVRSGVYEVRDTVTGGTARWDYLCTPGGTSIWSVGGWGQHPVDTLEWRGLTDFVWTSADGRETPIFMLDGEHAKNILRHLFRKAQEKRTYFNPTFAKFVNDWEGGFDIR